MHLHALCTLLREHLQNREEFETDEFDCQNRSASPASIRRAVDELATDIASAVDPENGDSRNPSDDGPRTASGGGAEPAAGGE